MSAGFTPGPWFVKDSPTLSIVGQEDHPVIAELCAIEFSEGEAEFANARLIAAAPSLYSDAEFLCARVREMEGALDGDSEAARQFFGHIIPALARMESALAEARGDQ